MSELALELVIKSMICVLSICITVLIIQFLRLIYLVANLAFQKFNDILKEGCSENESYGYIIFIVGFLALIAFAGKLVEQFKK